MVTHTGQRSELSYVDGRRRKQDSISKALRTRVRFPPPPQPALGSLGTRMGAGDLTV